MSRSKNGLHTQLIRYDANIEANDPNKLLALSVNGPFSLYRSRYVSQFVRYIHLSPKYFSFVQEKKSAAQSNTLCVHEIYEEVCNYYRNNN